MRHNTNSPRILVLLGPSGVGKTSIRRSLQYMDSRFVVIPAWTTRPEREGEVDRVHVSEEEFVSTYSRSTFLPMNEVYGARYATPKEPIAAAVNLDFFPVLDWPLAMLNDLAGALPVSSMSVYLRPPTTQELAFRLSLDGRDLQGARLRQGIEELRAFDLYSLQERVDLVVTVHRGRQHDAAAAILKAFLSDDADAKESLACGEPDLVLASKPD